MGYNRWKSTNWVRYSSSTKNKSIEQIYTSMQIKDELNPLKIQFRESRDSEKNPESTPVIVALDVTGSMGFISKDMATNSLGIMVEEILKRRPISDPHILFMGIGDADCGDAAPLQVTQFEADNSIIPQLTSIYQEGGGGGNNFESYDLAWAFASAKTKTDAWNKRKNKGYLFTIGDEMFPTPTRNHYEKIAGIKNYEQMSAEDVLKEAQKRYHVFHIIVQEGSFASLHLSDVTNSWKSILNKRVLLLSDHLYIAQVIVSAICLSEGMDYQTVIDQWQDDHVKKIVKIAIP